MKALVHFHRRRVCGETCFVWIGTNPCKVGNTGHDAGTTMDVVETLLFWLALFWLPPLAFVAYLLLPRWRVPD